MDITRKLSLLADAAKYDASCSSSGSKVQRGKDNAVARGQSGKGLGSLNGMGICHSFTPDGRCVSLLKILLTNHCIFDCKYCINRVSSDVERARFTTEEVVKLTLDFYRRNYIEGLFLSSGIMRDSDFTMEQIVAVAKSLRLDHGFRGYIHLKTIPGASDDLLADAGLYADRLSVNIELPTAGDLQKLAPEKNRPQLERNMSGVLAKATELKDARRSGLKKVPTFVPAGQTTQMIVGATPTQDRDILLTSVSLYDRFKLKRVYYSAFSPIPHADARLPSQAPPLVREHRLYQADWLMRFYGFAAEEIVPADAPDLSADLDPKSAWALRNPHLFPLDINRASREQLLRVPGLGVRSVERMLQIRRYHRLTLQDLQLLRVPLGRARPFIITNDWQPTAQLIKNPLPSLLARPAQLSLELGVV